MCHHPLPHIPCTTATSNATFPLAKKKEEEGALIKIASWDFEEGVGRSFSHSGRALRRGTGVVLCKKPHWAHLFCQCRFPCSSPPLHPLPGLFSLMSLVLNMYFFPCVIKQGFAGAGHFTSFSSLYILLSRGIGEKTDRGVCVCLYVCGGRQAH